MRIKFVSDNPADAKWLMYGKNKAAQMQSEGSHTLTPTKHILLRYGKDSNGPWVTLLRAARYRHVPLALPNPIPYKTLAVTVIPRIPAGGSSITLMEVNHDSLITGLCTMAWNDTQLYVGPTLLLTHPREGTTCIGTADGLNAPVNSGSGMSYDGRVYTTDTAYTWNGSSWQGITTTTYSDPYRATIDAAIAASAEVPGKTIVATSTTVLASENQLFDTVWGQYVDGVPQFQVLEYYPGSIFNQGQFNYLGRTKFEWNGGENIWMFGYRGDNGANSGETFNHKLTFTVPEDCIAGVVGQPNYPGIDGATYATEFSADWAAGQAASVTRNAAWLNKNHTTVLAQLKAGTFASVAWDYLLKANAPTSTKTKRPILMASSYEDTLLSDTSANLTQAGTKTTQRVVTFSYTAQVLQPDESYLPTPRTQIVTGTRTEVVTSHTRPSDSTLTTCTTYASWYMGENVDAPGGFPTKLSHKFLRDGGAHRGMGLLWNGVIQQGYLQDSTFGTPQTPADFVDYNPAYPVYSNTLASTPPTLVTTYRNDVKPVYDASGTTASTAWNDSALVDEQIIKIILFGPKDKGMFGVWAGETVLHLYGAVKFRYSYATGDLIFVGFTKPKDVNGTEQDIVTFNLNGAPTPTVNSYVKYSGLEWADVITAAAAAEALLKPPATGPDNRTAAQKLQYEICAAV